jgi:colicin import membrane protein
MMDLKFPRPRAILPAPDGWRSALLALVVHAVFFAVLAFGLHWKRFLPPIEDDVTWVLPQEAEVAPQPDKTDTENTSPQAASVAKPEPADVKLGASGTVDTDGASAKPAAEAKSKPAEPAPAEPKEAAPDAPDAEPGDAVIDGKKLVNDLKIRVASKTQFTVPSSMRETNVPVEFTLRLAPDGTVADLQLVQASDNPEYDDAVRQGILDAQPYPHDMVNKGDEIDIRMRPIEIDFVHRFPTRTTLPN